MNTEPQLGEITPGLQRIIQDMSLEDRVGQLLMVVPVESIMRRVHAGTVICMDGDLSEDIEESRQWCIDLQQRNAEVSSVPLWIHGFVCEKEWTGPVDKRLAAEHTEPEAEEICHQLGRLWRHIGLHTNPRPSVNVPIFDTCIAADWTISSDPDKVVRYARAITRGLHRARCGNMAQHFPAHGATAADSHLEIPVIELSREDLMRDHIAPYQASFAEGCTTICTAHLRCPALDPDPEPIATTSRPILTDFLRGELGFRGVTIADCVSMQGFQRMGDVGATSVQAVLAGCDSLCCTLHDDTAERMFDALLAAAQTGALPEARLTEAVGRNLSFKRWLGLLD